MLSAPRDKWGSSFSKCGLVTFIMDSKYWQLLYETYETQGWSPCPHTNKLPNDVSSPRTPLTKKKGVRGFAWRRKKQAAFLCRFWKTKLYHTWYCYSIKPRSTWLESHSSSPKGRLPATLSPIVMRPPEDVATLAQRWQKKGRGTG